MNFKSFSLICSSLFQFVATAIIGGLFTFLANYKFGRSLLLNVMQQNITNIAQFNISVVIIKHIFYEFLASKIALWWYG